MPRPGTGGIGGRIPDKELKASAVKELDPPGRDAPIATGDVGRGIYGTE